MNEMLSSRGFSKSGSCRAAVFLLCVALLVAFLGGSSRADAVQIVVLRPVAALSLIPAIYFCTRDRLADFRIPFFLLCGLIGLMTLQLVPLPPAIWQVLPGRVAVADLAAVTGSTDVWRPISMVPARNLNALLSLMIPLTALLLAAASGFKRSQLLLMVVAIGVVDAVVGLTQIVSGGHEGLYFYAVTNSGTAVGLFANQNHSAVFGATALLVTGYLLADQPLHRWRVWPRAALTAVFMIILLAAMVGGSRAGLLTTVIALLASAVMFWLGYVRKERDRAHLPKIFGFQLSSPLLFAAVILLVGSIIGAFIAFDRIVPLQNLTDNSSFDDLRWQLMPTLQAMIGTYWFLGSGFGSFEEVYHIFEPTELLEPIYVNQAHNDWAQLLIEGGILAVLLVAGLAVWFAGKLRSIGGRSRQALASQLLWITLAASILFASLVDYPLRTPLFQFVTIILIAALCRETTATDV